MISLRAYKREEPFVKILLMNCSTTVHSQNIFPLTNNLLAVWYCIMLGPFLVMICSYYAYVHLIDPTVSFEQQSYAVNESNGKVESVLVLSNPSSSVITVQVFSTNGSATGKQLTISRTIIEQLL